MAKITLNFDSADMQNAIKKIKKLESIDKKRTKILSLLRSSAKPLVTALKAAAPVSSAPHKIRSADGKRTVAPGNLKRSFGVIRSRNRRKAEIFVGAKAGKKGKKDDGFYANMVDGGHVMPNGKTAAPNPFILKTVAAYGGRVKLKITNGMRRFIESEL